MSILDESHNVFRETVEDLEFSFDDFEFTDQEFILFLILNRVDARTERK